MNNKKIIFVLILLLFGLFPPVFARQLSRSSPEKVGMSSTKLRRLDVIINKAILNNEFPGTVMIVGRHGKIVFRKAYGKSQLEPDSRPMQVSMLFDLASVTKPVATATSIMILIERGEIRLQDKVKDFIPDFKRYEKPSPAADEANISEKEIAEPGEDARLIHLLTHTSGLPPYLEKETLDQLGAACPTGEMVELIAGLDKLCPPGEEFHYSCLGFITLAHIIEKVSGLSVDLFAARSIFRPLQMQHTIYKPPSELYEMCVPTEIVGGRLLVGKVHDPLARLQGGISGNAGLFSTADDLAVFAQMLLNKGEFRKRRVLSPLTVERMTEIYRHLFFAGRGFGWDLESSYSSNTGDLFGPAAFGHTGYTGTSICIDPETDTFAIFLTNRVHPNDSGNIASLRSKVANVVAAAIIKK